MSTRPLVEHLFFGTRGLFGSLDRPQRLQRRPAAVLLCNPLGEEAVRAHRIYRVLARRLAASGYAVLRFDYSGTGDSAGEPRDAALDDWLDDVAAAADALRSASGARQLVACGIRLGGTLAALGTARRGQRLRHLVLWDPVVEGGGYLRQLAAAHRDYMRRELGSRWADALPIDADGYPAEALGVRFPPAFKAALAAVDLAREEIRADHLTVITTEEGPELLRLRERVGEAPTARWIATASSVRWNSDEALNAALVPADVLSTIVRRVEEVSP
jgi:pimeloyl-ACP methyl ester carboxylesterase